MQNLGLKIGISVGAFLLILAHLVWPAAKVDAITLGLLVLLILPWLSSLIESAEFPGGWKIKFKGVQEAGAKVTESNPGTPTALVAKPGYLEVANKDPNLALVGLRIEIEKRLRALAEKHQLVRADMRSLTQLFRELREREILNNESVSGLQELIVAGNRAAHGASVEPAVATWAVEYGPQVLSVLDAKLKE